MLYCVKSLNLLHNKNMECRRMEKNTFDSTVGFLVSKFQNLGLDIKAIGDRTDFGKSCDRKRRFTGWQILTLLLMWAAENYTSRELAAIASACCGFAISDVGLLKRFRKCEAFISEIAAEMLAVRNAKSDIMEGSSRFQLIDGSMLATSSSKLQERLHCERTIEIAGQDIRSYTGGFEITSTSGKGVGEKLNRSCNHFSPGDIVIADRGYFRAAGMQAVHSSGASFLLRYHDGTSPLYEVEDGTQESLRKISMAKRVGELRLRKMQYGQFNACVLCNDGTRIPVRVCVKRRSTEESEKTRRQKLRTTLHRRRTVKIRTETLALCDYVILVTTLPADAYDIGKIFRCYRLRWQVELFFKRIKSKGGMRRLTTRNESSSRVIAGAKMLLVLLTEYGLSGNGTLQLPADEKDSFDDIFDDAESLEDLQVSAEDETMQWMDFFWNEFAHLYVELKAKLVVSLRNSEMKTHNRRLGDFLNREINRKRHRACLSFGESPEKAS